MARILKAQVKDLKARFNFGVEGPRGVSEALRLDRKNGNNKWMETITKEKKQLFDFDTFEVLNKNEKAPKGYKRIPAFYVFDVKHDLRRKARFVAGSHMSIAPKEDSYSSVVDHENVRITLFLDEHNDLNVMAAEIGNAYLHAHTKEKVYIVAGPEFGPDLEGRVMLVLKSLYSLTTFAARWHEELSKTLRGMEFTPTKADHHLWIKDCGTHYEYLCTWVDDIVVASKDAMAILNEFKIKAKYTLKGVGEPSYYLGGNFGRLNTTLLPGKKSTCFLSARIY